MNDITIAAVATPFGRGGISVIRISGSEAIAVAEKMFQPKSGKGVSDLAPARAVWGDICAEGRFIDDGILTVFRAPHSYTGEDVVEISCHGGILITQKVLEGAFLCGAVQAGPGEFTKRAFLNGRMDLTQAEAVIDLIDAQSEEKLRLAGAQTHGVLKREIDGIFLSLKKALSSTYAYIDYPDEDLTDLTIEEFQETLNGAAQRLERLAQSWHTGKAVSQGVRCAIVGKPNTGKSSLLNALTGEDRAIVTDIPGTTRDVLQETVVLGKVLLHLADTAGIRQTEDQVEKLGVERSTKAIREAEIVFAVFDGSRPWEKEDISLLQLLDGDCPVVALINKHDLPQKLTLPDVPFRAVVEISAATGEGLDQLTDVVENLFLQGEIDYDSQGVIANARQYSAVKKALERVQNAKKALDDGFTQDVAGMDLELALSELGEVDGRNVSSQIVDDIFHNFCVGK